MNRNYLIAFGITVAVLGFIALAGWYLFEIEPRTRTTPVSREARINEYLALDRWLTSLGIPVRVVNSGNLSMISAAPEKNVFIQSSLFRWSDEAMEYLTYWIEDGGHLFLVLEPGWSWYDDDDELFLFLEEFEIETKVIWPPSPFCFEPDFPRFDRGTAFEASENETLLEWKDGNGYIRLVQAKRGNGKLTVSGHPRFILSANLREAPSAALAWEIFISENTGDGANGWLFIRGTARARGLLGNLWKHGNLTVLLISALVLLVIGFWAVLPVFGLVKHDREKFSRPLRERFLAEARFLKRFNALDFYCGLYLKEIKRRLTRNEGIMENDEMENRLLSDPEINMAEQDLLRSVLRGEAVKYRDFPKTIIVLKNLMERI